MIEQLSFGKPPLLEDTPENRQHLREVLRIFRMYFNEGNVPRELVAWARDQHQRLAEPKRRRKGDVALTHEEGGAEESGVRQRRMRGYGYSTPNTCAPMGWWDGEDIFAYLHAHDLPIHPAYAMTRGGQLDRNRIRVASLGGKRGSGIGRAEWEKAYYAQELAKIRQRGET